MIATAHTRYVRVTPQKARRVMNEVRGLDANRALDVLQFAPQKAAVSIRKTLVSALANAEQAARNNNETFDADDMFIVEAYVNEGPTMKRFRARAQGRGARILKRTSHLTIVVGDAEDKANLAKPYKPSEARAAAAERAAADEKAKASKKAAAKEAAKSEDAEKSSEKPAAKKPAVDAKKPAAKKPATDTKKPAAKKPATAKKPAAKADTSETDTKKGAK